MDRPLEPVGQFGATTGRAELLEILLQVGEGLPKQILHHVAIPVFVGVGKPNTARRGRPVNRRRDLDLVVDQPVAGVVQPDAVAQLRMKEAHHVGSKEKRFGTWSVRHGARQAF